MAGCARFVWNYGLAETKRVLALGEKLPSAYDLNKLLTVWKKQPEIVFLADAYTDNLQQKLKDLHTAWKRGIDKKLAANAAVFERKSDGNGSIRFVQLDKYGQIDNSRVKLPSKFGWVKFRKSQQIIGKIKNATISQKSGHWYISFQTEHEVAEPAHRSTSIVGIDAGVTKLATLSDATIYLAANSFKLSQKKLATLQRKLSRKVKFSSHWQKQKPKIQHSRIANICKDDLFKVTTTISKKYAKVVIFLVVNPSRYTSIKTEKKRLPYRLFCLPS